MYFADFETTTAKVSKEESYVWLWGIKGALDGDKLEYGISTKSFLEYVAKQKLNNIFFHNLSFDGNYIYKWLLDNKHEFIFNMTDDEKQLKQLKEKFGDKLRIEAFDYKLQSGEWTWLCEERGNIYCMEINFNGHVFRIYDSWKVLMSSVADLGISLGIPKLELDYDAYDIYDKKEDVPNEAIEYLERDIDVVKETFLKAINIYEKKMTRAGMSMNDFMKFYGEKNFADDFGGRVWNYREKKFEYKAVITKETFDLLARSYVGGYVNWNKSITNKEIICHNGISFDDNSLYPAMMLNNKYPYGRMYNTKPSGSHVTLYVVHIKSAHIKDDKYPGLIKHRKGKDNDGKYLKHLTHEERVIWKEEFEYLLKYYDMEYNIYKKKYFKTKYVFRDWLTEKMDLKINAKDPIERNFHKGIYNSLYGKFGQKYKLGARVIVKDNTPVEKRNKAQMRYGPNEEYVHKPIYIENEDYKHMAVASFTTMKARMTLFPAIMDNIDIWLYSDTDSCYFSDTPKGLWIHESAFGAWKPEHKFNKFKVLRAKCYTYFSTYEYKHKWIKDNKLIKKISGIDDEGKNNISWDNFFIGSTIKLGKRGSQNVKGGKLIMRKDYKLGKEENDTRSSSKSS